jgi:hypothetical protein
MGDNGAFATYFCILLTHHHCIAPPPPSPTTHMQDNDGIETLGRVGIFFGTVSLVMYLMAMIQPSWTVVENLGTFAVCVQIRYPCYSSPLPPYTLHNVPLSCFS